MDTQNVLIFGDSYANHQRFDAEVASAFAKHGIETRVSSISNPGFSSDKLLKLLLTSKKLQDQLHAMNLDFVLVITGIPDIVLGRGVKNFSRALSALDNTFRLYSKEVLFMEVVPFDENADTSALPHRIGHKFAKRIRDPHPNKIQRYRAAASAILKDRVISVSSSIPQFEEHLFTDRIHLTEEAFRNLALFVGMGFVQKLLDMGALVKE